MIRTEQQIISDMDRALTNCDDKKYDRLYAELQRVRKMKK